MKIINNILMATSLHLSACSLNTSLNAEHKIEYLDGYHTREELIKILKNNEKDKIHTIGCFSGQGDINLIQQLADNEALTMLEKKTGQFGKITDRISATNYKDQRTICSKAEVKQN